jgi:hypothetical protein
MKCFIDSERQEDGERAEPEDFLGGIVHFL